MIYDKGKIFTGLAAFLALVGSPFWYNPVLGTGATAPPEPKKAVAGTQCVLPKEQMRASHMQVIYDWRETVVRGGGRMYAHPGDPAGVQREMSLSNTCLACHQGKKDFCNTCHGYLAVQPFCWDCHFDPKEQA